jgi:hypothetical protein
LNGKIKIEEGGICNNLFEIAEVSYSTNYTIFTESSVRHKNSERKKSAIKNLPTLTIHNQKTKAIKPSRKLSI